MEAITRYAAYVEAMKPRLRLADYTISVTTGEQGDDPDCLAMTHCTPNRKVATIELLPLFFTQTRAEKRHILIHELLHIHTYPMLAKAALVEQHINPPTWDVWSRTTKEANEILTDELAYIVSRGLPLP